MAYFCKCSLVRKECDSCGGCEPAEPTYECPICEHILYSEDTIYLDKGRDCVGCEYCVTNVTAEDALPCGAPL